MFDHILLPRVLLTAYKAYLQPAWFTLDAYLWAVELWYAYAIQVSPKCVGVCAAKASAKCSLPGPLPTYGLLKTSF